MFFLNFFIGLHVDLTHLVEQPGFVEEVKNQDQKLIHFFFHFWLPLFVELKSVGKFMYLQLNEQKNNLFVDKMIAEEQMISLLNNLADGVGSILYILWSQILTLIIVVGFVLCHFDQDIVPLDGNGNQNFHIFVVIVASPPLWDTFFLQ